MVRECFALPAIFLTVALLGGFRAAASVRLVPPPLMSLVLGLLLMGCLARAHVIVPEHLMNSRRSAAANFSGLVVLLSLFAACTQIFNLLTPDTGLLHLIFSTFFLVQLLTTLTAVRDRLALLRGLTVLLGSAFVIRFALLESLYSPHGGVVKRVLTALMEGITLGGLEYAPNGLATGYVAFFTLTLFIIGLVLLGPERHEPGQGLQRWGGDKLATTSMILLAIGMCACRSQAAPSVSDDTTEFRSVKAGDRASETREAALASARVWNPPSVPIGQAVLGENPPGGWSSSDVVDCRFVAEAVNGMTPKFNCQLADGEVVKVKYGKGNAEIHGEVAATRLLSALGFTADRMYVVRSVRCAECPPYPFYALRCLEKTGSRALCLDLLDGPGVVEFNDAVIERRHPGRTDRGLRRPGMGVVRARQDRSGPRRIDAGPDRRLPPDGDAPLALGQQGGEPTADLRGGRRSEGRAVRPARGDDAGCRFHVRTEEARPAQLATDADLGGRRRVPCQHEAHAVGWRDVSRRADFRGRPAAGALAPGAAVAASTRDALYDGQSHVFRQHQRGWPQRTQLDARVHRQDSSDP